MTTREVRKVDILDVLDDRGCVWGGGSLDPISINGAHEHTYVSFTNLSTSKCFYMLIIPHTVHAHESAPLYGYCSMYAQSV
jgi:hypothetical protein